MSRVLLFCVDRRGRRGKVRRVFEFEFEKDEGGRRKEEGGRRNEEGEKGKGKTVKGKR
jgi:hypothetical protein